MRPHYDEMLAPVTAEGVVGDEVVVGGEVTVSFLNPDPLGRLRQGAFDGVAVDSVFVGVLIGAVDDGARILAGAVL